MIRTAWHPLARRELQDAASAYEEASPGLGPVFLDAVERAVGQLARLPLTGRRIRGQARRLSVERFPYSLFYRCEPADDQPESLFILAIAHHRRNPDYWAARGRK